MVDIAHLGRPQRVAFAALLVCVSATYARVAIRRCKPGSSRLISALPVLLGNVYLPTLFRSQSDIVVCSLVCLCLLWLCNLKVLAMCYERGPLCQSRSALQFLTIFALPVTPREKAVDDMQAQFVGRFLLKMAIWLVLTYVQSAFSKALPQIVLELVQAVSIYTFVGFIYDGLEVVMAWAIGLRIAPQFDKPFLAESIASFWGRRWNLPMGICLREAAYEPICQGQAMAPKQSSRTTKPSPGRHLAALSASFALSGLAHELMFWYVMGQHTPRWKWLVFFTIQAPLIAAECVGSRTLQRRGIKVPAWLSIPVTLTVLFLTAHALFFSVWYGTEFGDRVETAILDDLHSIATTFAS